MGSRWRQTQDLAVLEEHGLMESRREDFPQDEVTSDEDFVQGDAYCSPVPGCSSLGPCPAGRGCRHRWGEEPRGACRWLVDADPP